MRAASEWKEIIAQALDGVEGGLCRSAPNKTRLALTEFRRRLDSVASTRERKRFERDLDAFVESKPHLRAAFGRYVSKRLIAFCEELARASKKVQRILAKQKKAPLAVREELARATRNLERFVAQNKEKRPSRGGAVGKS
jgi:hypothetical protein